MLPEEFLWDVEHNGFAFNPDDFLKADEQFQKTPQDTSQYGYTWAEGWEQRNLKNIARSSDSDAWPLG